MRVLLLGGSGQLGMEIKKRWSVDAVTAPSHEDVDVGDVNRLSFAVAGTYGAVVNCTAFHNVDVCETHAGAAFAINALAVDALADACVERDIPFITISTDYVFDGKKRSPYLESDCPHPLSAYGTSKLAGELLVERRNIRAFVVRTCGIYGTQASKSKGTFIDRVIAQARNGETIRVVNDVVASPTYAGHLADGLRQLLETKAYGLYHMCNMGAVTWYEFAKKALELAGIDHPIEPISANEWKAAAVRPAYSALASEKLEALGIHMPSWQDGIAEYLRDKALQENA